MRDYLYTPSDRVWFAVRMLIGAGFVVIAISKLTPHKADEPATHIKDVEIPADGTLNVTGHRTTSVAKILSIGDSSNGAYQEVCAIETSKLGSAVVYCESVAR